MTATDEMTRVSHLVPTTVKELASERSEYGELSERVRSAYEMAAYGETEGKRSHLQLQLQQIRDEKDRVRTEIQTRKSELANLDRHESRLNDRLNDVSEAAQKYEGHLESIEGSLYDGQHIDPGHGAVTRAADSASKSPADVIDDIKERNPNIPDYAFIALTETDKRWHGIDPDGSPADPGPDL